MKGGGRYICKRCGVKDVQIAQMGGRETLNQLFKDLSEAELKAFWQRAGQTKDSKALKAMVDTMVESKHSEGTVVVEGGTYQPLSWFKKNGYNTKKVKKHCRKTMKHPVWGRVYLVDNLTVNRHRENWKAKKRVYTARNRPAEGSQAAPEPEKDEAEPGPSQASAASTSCTSEKTRRRRRKRSGKKGKTDTSSRSRSKERKERPKKRTRDKSSSSSSVERKRKKRARKEAAEKKAREKEEAAKKLKEEKDAKTATTWRAKLAPVLLSCRTLTKSKDFGSIPEWAKETIEAEIQALATMDKTLASVESKKAHLKLANDEVSLAWIIWVAIRIALSSLVTVTVFMNFPQKRSGSLLKVIRTAIWIAMQLVRSE